MKNNHLATTERAIRALSTQEVYQAAIATPVGKLGIATVANNLTNIDFLAEDAECFDPIDTFSNNIVKQLQAYFDNPAHIFNLPLGFHGTLFQNNVWRELQKIPLGRTVTYSSLAHQLQTGPRAIGNACRNNPIPIVIPCHRVVAINHIGGYSGGTSGRWAAIKQWLLQHEGII